MRVRLKMAGLEKEKKNPVVCILLVHADQAEREREAYSSYKKELVVMSWSDVWVSGTTLELPVGSPWAVVWWE